RWLAARRGGGWLRLLRGGRPRARPRGEIRPQLADTVGRLEGRRDHGPGFRTPPARPVRGIRGPGPRARGRALDRARRRSHGPVRPDDRPTGSRPLHRRGRTPGGGLRRAEPGLRRPVVLVRGFHALRRLGPPTRLTRRSSPHSRPESGWGQVLN